MNADELELFEQCLGDIEIFISGFEKQAQGPSGARFAEPLERLKLIKKNLLNLRRQSTSRHSRGGLSAELLNSLEETQKQNFQVLRSDLQQLSQSSGGIQKTVKSLQAIERQMLSLSQASMEAAQRLRTMLEKTAGLFEKHGSPAAPAAAPASDEALAHLDESLESVEAKLIAIARGLSRLDAKVGADSGELPSKVQALSDELERRATTLEIKLQGLLERADLGGLLDKLEPRFRNFQDGLKVLLDEVRKSQKSIEKLRKGDGQPNYEARFDIIAKHLDELAEGQRALRTSFEAGAPAAGAPAAGSPAAGSPAAASPSEASAELGGLREVILENSKKVDRLIDRQGAIDDLSLVLHPLSNNYQQLVARFDETQAATDARMDELGGQVTAMQAMIRNLYRMASKALEERPATAASPESEPPTAAAPAEGEAPEKGSDWWTPNHDSEERPAPPLPEGAVDEEDAEEDGEDAGRAPPPAADAASDEGSKGQ